MSTSVASPIVAAAGGSFLLEARTPAEVFTPEDLNEEQRQIAATAAQFAREQILPNAAAIEAKEPGVMAGLIRKAAELGFASVDIPEEYGGMGMDKTTSTLITDHLSVLASFSTAFGAHIGIATLPLVWYGTEEQKQRYLPKLASGEWIGSYGLSEASSGSDAMNVRTRATLSEDGATYTLNGEKMWITNCGIAGLYTVFAKILDPASGVEKFSAFLIERTTPGLTVGAEEHKLGIHGSSTCPLILDGCKIPASNLLGEAGKGHHIAFNVLNMGRLKLGVACIGGARHALGHMIRYAKERIAFGKPIAEFGLIQRKISASATRLYAAESMAYRTVGMIDAALAQIGSQSDPAHALTQRETQKRIEEYAVECSILKVYGSEMLSLVADELVATMGGYGYVEEYPAERFYRDARINRIFEGTNEINRLIITGWLMKRAVSGQLPLLAAIKKLMDEAMQPPSFDAGADTTELLAREAEVLTATKKVALFAAGVASQRFMTALQDQQEVMADLADIIMQAYALESALLRARKLARPGISAGELAVAHMAANMTGLLADESMALAEQAARRVLAACAEGDLLRTQLAILRRLARFTPADAVGLSRAVAQECFRRERYPL
jgi:alkylation response protein AidB-like acyl-CoA dehydrogenase